MSKQFNRSAYIKSQGLAAEKIAVNYFSSKGYRVEINPDEWGWWDLKVDDSTVQVKCLTPFVKHSAWSIGDKGKAIENLNKADKLMIVSVPMKNETEYDGWLVEIDRSKCKLEELEKSTVPGQSFVIPMEEGVVKKVYKLTEEEENAILKFSTSYMTRKASDR